MKIALSADGRSPHTQRWANALVARGHDLTVVWPPEYVSASHLAGYRPEVDHVATWSPLSTGRDQTPIEVARPGRLARRIKPDLVQGMNLVKCGWTAVALGRPLVQFVVGSDIVTLGAMPGSSPRRLAGNAYRRVRTLDALKRADAVLCDSSAVVPMVHERAPQMPVEVIRFGVELTSDANVSERPWRSELAIADDAFVLLSTRLMKPNYNIDTIIRAFSIVLRTIPNAVLVLKDFESMGEPEYRERCHRLVAELGLQNAVRNVGELDRPDLLALYRSADVFLSVPTNDATAVSVMEAMAAAVPVIASWTDGRDPDVLKDGDSALLVTPQDEHELAKAIISIHSSPELRGRLAQQGEATVRSVGDLEQEVAKAERLYLELIDASSRQV